MIEENMIGQVRGRTLRSLLAPVLASVLACGVLLVPTQARAVEGGYTFKPTDTDMAQIWKDGGNGAPDVFMCSGTVTSPSRVLTADHCFESKVSHYHVRVGRTELGKGSKHKIARKESRGDLAVLAIESEMKIKVPYAQLPSNETVPNKMELMSYGWGKTCATCDRPSSMLKSAETRVNDSDPILRDAKRGTAYRIFVRNAQHKKPGDTYTRIRKGDSGGPSSVFPSMDWPRVVYGVASKADHEGPYATISATYDAPKDQKPQPVYDWLRMFGQMKVYRLGQDTGHNRDELRKRGNPDDDANGGAASSDAQWDMSPLEGPGAGTTYDTMINTLRTAAGHPFHDSSIIETTDDGERIVRVAVKPPVKPGQNPHTVMLYFTAHDLVLRGWSNGETLFQFDDWDLGRRLNREATTMGFDATPSGLRGAWPAELPDDLHETEAPQRNLSAANIEKAMDILYTSGDPESHDTAWAALVIRTATTGAARYGAVAADAKKAIEQGDEAVPVVLDDTEFYLLDNWDRLSEHAHNVNNDPNTDPLEVAGQEIGGLEEVGNYVEVIKHDEV